MKTQTTTLNPELPRNTDAYWHAANYLSVAQIHLYDNPLLKRPLCGKNRATFANTLKSVFMATIV